MNCWRWIRWRGVGFCASLVLLGATQSSQAAFTTTGVYDETVTQMNNVDFNGAFSSGTGGATAANTTTASTGNGAVYSSIGLFNASLTAAFAANAGGVWSFDTQAAGVIPNGNTLTYGVAQNKSIVLTETGANQFMAVTTGGPQHNSLTTSGSNYLDNENGTPYAFTFGGISGGTPGETGVIQLGFTALSSNDSVGGPLNFGTVTAIANFSGGGSVTETATINALQGQGDTFFGFVAPSGQTITGFSVSSSGLVNGGTTGSPDIDDIAFITNAAVPEPSTYVLLASGLALLGLRRLRRR
jgi:hypothetical protein